MRSKLLSLRLNSLTKILIDLGEHLISPLSDSRLSARQVTSDIADEIVLLALLPAEDFPQHTRLHKVLVCDRELLCDSGTSPFLVLLAGLDGLVGHVAVGRWIVGVGAVVAVDSHDAIALVRVESAERLVNRNLLVIDAEAVAVGIGIGKEAGLENWVCGWLNTRNHV